MIIKNKRYCDECGKDNAQRYYEGWIVHDYCLECVIKRNMI